jgi:hypothetical protein
MEQIIEMFIGIGLTLLIGLAVSPFLRTRIPFPEGPEGLGEKDWREIVERTAAGKWIGLFERLFFLAAFWLGQYVMVGGWLAFKMAAKWEVWKNIIQVPKDMEGISSLNWYKARDNLGSYIFGRFLVGTLLNIFVGLIAAYLGSHSFEFFRYLCEL